MDRLICGDVGFGKTEVAMRASFLMVSKWQTSSNCCAYDTFSKTTFGHIQKAL